jgi:hypothetical protein
VFYGATLLFMVVIEANIALPLLFSFIFLRIIEAGLITQSEDASVFLILLKETGDFTPTVAISMAANKSTLTKIIEYEYR